jgi:integrase
MRVSLKYDLRHLAYRNKDGSYGTQAERLKTLAKMADDLKALGFQNMTADSLKPKHVEALVKQWHGQRLAVGTIKNRMSALRWWAEKVGKPNVVAGDNAFYGIAERQYVTNETKAIELPSDGLDKVTDPWTRYTLRLQAAFGLRREEAIKFRPKVAVEVIEVGQAIKLKASWCKGGRARDVPIRTAEQVALLQEVAAFCKGGSLIPSNKLYVDQLNTFKHQTAKAGLSKSHGLRHQYAQRRYMEETGFPCPALGGPTSKQLGPDDKARDHDARLKISRELGHEREQITAVYLGR